MRTDAAVNVALAARRTVAIAGDISATLRQCLVLVKNLRSHDVGQAEHELHGKVCRSLNHKFACSYRAVKTTDA